MSSDDKLPKAYERAKASVTREGSYSNVWKAIEEIGLTSDLYFFRFRKETLLSIMGIKKLSRAGMDRVGDHGSSVT